MSRYQDPHRRYPRLPTFSEAPKLEVGEHFLAIEEIALRYTRPGREVIEVHFVNMLTGLPSSWAWIVGQGAYEAAAARQFFVTAVEGVGGQELSYDELIDLIKDSSRLYGARIRAIVEAKPLKNASTGRKVVHIAAWHPIEHAMTDRILERRMFGDTLPTMNSDARGDCEKRAFELNRLSMTNGAVVDGWLGLGGEIEAEQEAMDIKIRQARFDRAALLSPAERL